MKKALVLGIAAVLLACAYAASAGAAEHPSSFGRMFPNLPAFTEPTLQQLADLAQTQLDPNTDDSLDNPAVPAGFTYLGQFIDHDLTRDQSPPPTEAVDPTGLENFRTFRFDLDSVYGGGPDVSPQLYAADHEHLLVQNPNSNGVRDLPRNSDGSAIVGDNRNDENEIISQLHVAFLLAHNRLIDEGNTFADARKILTENYQWIVAHDYLDHVVGQARVDAVGQFNSGFYKPGDVNAPMTPVEFSVAAFRFGHSEVRTGYEVNETSGRVNVFDLAGGPDLNGGRELPAGNQIEWGNFFTELRDPADPDFNLSRRIDTEVSSSLFQLPIPGAEADGSNVLAFRNMTRALFYGLPSGQEVARAMGLPVITPAELNLGPGFDEGTPLWYYILAESQRVEDGLRLGPVGGTIVAETLMDILKIDKNSYLNDNGFAPDEEIAGDDGVLTMSDLLVFAGVAGGD